MTHLTQHGSDSLAQPPPTRGTDCANSPVAQLQSEIALGDLQGHPPLGRCPACATLCMDGLVEFALSAS